MGDSWACRFRNVDKIVGREIHLQGINLEFESGSRNVLLGRTLAGKTSLLRIMAGLDRPSKGRILIDGRDVTGVSVRKRSVAMVYQIVHQLSVSHGVSKHCVAA